MIRTSALSLRVGLAVLALVALTFSSAFAAPAQAASSAWFSSPSKNIGCFMDSTGARCDILAYSYKAPRKPASCQLAWGFSVALGMKGKGHFACVIDTVAGSTKILKYGTSRTTGRFRCTSRTTGMTCTDTKNGHGFRISKASYSLF